jgi:predicted amidohydrolase
MLLCTELWALEQARAYGNAGSHLLVVPRITGRATLDKWIVGGKAAAIVAGAFCASSNRISSGGEFGGQGWIIGPDGDMLGLTSQKQPFISITIDLQRADEAKTTYPRYIFSTSDPSKEIAEN